MSLTINHNAMASSAARSLGRHYDSLAVSVRRLSSGLRVGQAADDAAGLAIRELMRADIAALNQGIRNANDAISMIQTHDGALQVIDEKLIRMKELAEQAATGTYNSTQRQMIDNEFQAMKSEITRIAEATEFNGVKLLCRDKANKLRVTMSEGRPNAPRVEPELVGAAGEILNPDAITKDAQISYVPQGSAGWTNSSMTGSGADAFSRWNYSPLDPLNTLEGFLMDVPLSFGFNSSTHTWNLSQATIDAFAAKGVSASIGGFTAYLGFQILLEQSGNYCSAYWEASSSADSIYYKDLQVNMTFSASGMTFTSGTAEYPNVKYLKNDLWDLDGDGVADVRAEYSPGGGSFSLRAGAEGEPGSATETEDYVTKIHFGTGNDSAEDYYYIYDSDCTAKGLGIGNLRVQTQDNAQRALTDINDAIITKDSVRAYFGATQNRLENTISNLRIQAENAQQAESRISDVDVALEMTSFIRSQILTQSATSMLAQANSTPQMVMQLLNA